MRIILDNQEKKDFHRIVVIQQNTECIFEIVNIFVDALKAYGFTEEEIFEVLTPKEDKEI